jgi:hypothetical protein
MSLEPLSDCTHMGPVKQLFTKGGCGHLKLNDAAVTQARALETMPPLPLTGMVEDTP